MGSWITVLIMAGIASCILTRKQKPTQLLIATLSEEAFFQSPTSEYMIKIKVLMKILLTKVRIIVFLLLKR